MAVKGIGRPQAKIDWSFVDYKLMAGYSGVAIANELGINCNTLYERTLLDKGIPFSEYSQQKYEKGNNLIKEKQFEKATKKGDNMMLIWLGKNRCGQKDRHDETNEDLGKALREFLEQHSNNSKRLSGDSRPSLEAQQPLLDQGCSGEACQVQTELGTTGNCEGIPST